MNTTSSTTPKSSLFAKPNSTPKRASMAAPPTSRSSRATTPAAPAHAREALIAAGLKRVVAATIDPNPNVAGHGADRLRSAGVEVTLGVCQAEARRLNEGFARWIQHKRPSVLMKVAMTLDGRIAPPAGQHTAHEPYWITSETARRAVQPLRWQADAAMTGVDTVIADDPLLTDRSGFRRRRPMLRVVLDSALRMPLDCKMVNTANNDVVIFTVTKDREPHSPASRSRNPRRGAAGGSWTRADRQGPRSARQ